MVKVIFLNLLRSKYGIHEILVQPGTMSEVLDQIRAIHPQILVKDFEEAVLYVNHVRIPRFNWEKVIIKDADEIELTHFVGGG